VKYTGHWHVSGKLLTVSYSWHEKSTQVGGSLVDALAKIILSELVEAERKAST